MLPIPTIHFPPFVGDAFSLQQTFRWDLLRAIQTEKYVLVLVISDMKIFWTNHLELQSTHELTGILQGLGRVFLHKHVSFVMNLFPKLSFEKCKFLKSAHTKILFWKDYFTWNRIKIKDGRWSINYQKLFFSCKSFFEKTISIYKILFFKTI